jgi:hypothetical protein
LADELIEFLCCNDKSGTKYKRSPKSRAKLSQVISELTVLLPHTGGESFPSADKIADRSSMHLPHELGSVQLDGDYAYAEVERDLFVDAALCHFTQHLPLARGESFKPLHMLEEAMNMLRDANESVASVAAALGYSSQTSFAAAFRKLTGEAPRDWRRRMR